MKFMQYKTEYSNKTAHNTRTLTHKQKRVWGFPITIEYRDNYVINSLT